MHPHGTMGVLPAHAIRGLNHPGAHCSPQTSRTRAGSGRTGYPRPEGRCRDSRAVATSKPLSSPAPPAIISELKKASPSKGLLAPEYDPATLAPAYERGGAAALSVLTDSEYFQGSLADLEAARAATRIPVLRKDFTVDPAQIVEAAAHGADAILLIAAILSDAELRDFRELAANYRMASLVEVHDAAELRRALDSGARIVGVNNRDLRTFEVRLETSLDLAAADARRRDPGGRERHHLRRRRPYASAPPGTTHSWLAST